MTAKIKRNTIKTLPTLRSAKYERGFWITISFIFLAIFLLLNILSARQGNPLPVIVQILWVGIFIMPLMYFTIRSFQRIKQIVEFESTYLLQYGTITGQHEEDSVLGDQASAIVYWLHFKMNGECIYKQRVSLAAYKQLKPGDQIVVRVSPNNPHLCRAEVE